MRDRRFKLNREKYQYDFSPPNREENLFLNPDIELLPKIDIPQANVPHDPNMSQYVSFQTTSKRTRSSFFIYLRSSDFMNRLC